MRGDLGNFKIAIEEPPDIMGTKVWIYREIEATEIQVIYYDTETQKTSLRSFKQGMLIPPTIILSRGIPKLLLQALIDKGVKSESESLVTGKLEATKYHLEDMRKLLKLTKG